MDYMTKNRDYFSQYITEEFDEYVARKRHPHCHGNYIEMQAISEMFNRPIEVYQVPRNTHQFFYRCVCVHLHGYICTFLSTIGIARCVAFCEAEYVRPLCFASVHNTVPIFF